MNKNEIKSNNTKKKLCDAFIFLYQKKDIENITVSEITQKAKYNRGTFYLYFTDIYDMREKIKKNLLKQINEEVDKILFENSNFNIKEMFSFLLNFHKKNKDYIIPLLTKDINFINSIKENIKPLVYKIFKIENKNMKEANILIEYHLSAIIGVINYYSKNENISLDELVEIIYNVSTKGVINVLNKNS